MARITQNRAMTQSVFKLENVHWISIPVHIGDPIGVAYHGGAT